MQKDKDFNPESDVHHRKIRSFVRREGRLTPGQRYALEELYEHYGLDEAAANLNLAELFPKSAPIILEIGFGMGQSLLAQATHHPEQNFLGIEVHRPGVGALLAGAEKAKLNNIRVFCADAVEVLNKHISDNSLAGVQIFFPDPWPKKRHHKRRLVQAEFIALLVKKLQPGGFIHCATDWQNYAEHMLEVLGACPNLQNQSQDHTYCERPAHRPLTKFEQRGLKLGHGVWDLIFIKK